MVAANWPYYLINSTDVIGIIVDRRHIGRGHPLPCDMANDRSAVPVLEYCPGDDFSVFFKADGGRAVGPKGTVRLR